MEIKYFFVFIFTLLLSVTSHAEEWEVTQVVQLYGHVLKYPPPSWVKRDPSVLKQSNFNRQQAGNQFILEAIPKNEDFENWSSLFGVFAERNAKLTPKTVKSNMSQIYAGACDGVAMQEIASHNGVETFALFCSHFKNEANYGQIGLFTIVQSGDVTTRIYQEWKGEAFNIKEPIGWPVSPDALVKSTRAFLSEISFFPKN